MGIRNDGNLGSHGVSLAFLQPGFPASQVLKIGDRVIAAAGVTIDTWETMRAVIISRDPGDEIPITVVREGATLNLTVGLGDFTRLREPINLDALILNEAWRMRSRGLDDPEPVKAGIIASGLPASAWSTQYGLLADEAAELGLTTSRNGPDPGIALVPGGEPRGGLQGAVQPPIMQRGAFNARGGANRLPGQPLVAPQDAAALVQQQQLLAQQQKFWVLKSLETDRQAQLDALNQQMADPAMDPQARQAVKMRIEGVTQSLKSIREDLARVDALVNPKGNVH